jgi:hypothetical protein
MKVLKVIFSIFLMLTAIIFDFYLQVFLVL